MVIIKWGGILGAVLASAGLAWGQQAVPGGAGPRGGDKVVSVRETDGPEQKGRLLQIWTTAGGQRACLVQLLDSQELLTVVENPAKPGGVTPGGRSVGAQIYHWGNSPAPPAGSPPPPGWMGSPSEVRPTAAQAVAPQASLSRPPIQPTSAVPEAGPVAPPPATVCTPTTSAASAACATGTCKEGCPAYVYRYERAPRIFFKPGACLPVCPPYHAPSYGYHQTQWRSWGSEASAAADELPLPPQPEGLPTPAVVPARHR